MRFQHILIVCIASLLLAGESMALNWEMPTGTWQTDDKSEVSLEILIQENFAIQLVVVDGDARITIKAKYETTAVKFADYHVDITPLEIAIFSGNETSEVQNVELMSFEFAKDVPLQATMIFDCAHNKEYLQFCLHGEKNGEPLVFCTDMFDESSTCEPTEPLDGSKINQPIDR